MTLAEQRRAIRHLLDEQKPADASAVYFAFHYPDHKTQLVTYPPGAERAIGYIALSRTGIDLFRPFITLRLPIHDLTTSADLIYTAFTPGMSVIMDVPARYLPLLQALFEVQAEEHLQLYRLDHNRFEPVINVLITQETGPNNLPRFVIRRRNTAGGEEILATAGLNWQSPHFAEISVNTNANYRRQGYGRSVVAAMVNHLLQQGITPLYLVAENNEASIQLAENLGFVDTGHRQIFLQGTLKPRP